MTPLDRIPAGLVLLDSKMTYRFANGIYGQLLGYGADELLGRDVRETVHPSDLANYIEQSERFSQGIGYSFHITMRARGGHAQPLAVQTAPILSEGVFHGGFATVQAARPRQNVDAREIRRLSFLASHYTAMLHRRIDPLQSTADVVASAASAKDVAQLLSPRELQVYSCLMQGMSSAEVAEALRVSPHTARNHIKGIYRKLAVRSRAQLMARVPA